MLLAPVEKTIEVRHFSINVALIANIEQRVLDVGTGTGIWAIDFADDFPDTMVFGTDISPTQPDLVYVAIGSHREQY